MPSNTKENGFETLIVNWLVNENGYEQGTNADYNQEYAIDEERLFRYLQSTQPRDLAELRILDTPAEKKKFLERLSRKLSDQGVIEILRKGFKYKNKTLDFYQVLPSKGNQRRLSEEVLRFHVLANSDSREDQALKLKVRDKVLEFLEANMADEQHMTEDETVMWIREHIDEIEDVSRRCVAEENYDYPVTAAVTTCWFPDKTYGDVTFPAGNYEALRIEIGSAKGHNWWCVLYPSLCFRDAANAVVPNEGKEKLKHVLTEEEYSEITAGTEFKISWYFWKKK